MPGQGEAVTTSTPSGANVRANELDRVTDLLFEPEKEQEVSDEAITDEEQAEPDEEEEEEGSDKGEEQEADGEPELEAAEGDDEDLTWGKALGVDDKQLVLDDDGNLKAVRVVVDGTPAEVKMSDLIAGYQTNKYNTQKSQALAEEFKKFTETKQLVTDTYVKKVEQVEKLTEYLHASFMREYNDVDWGRLRLENPAEYAAAIQDFQMRDAEIKGLYENIQQEKQAEVSQLTEAQQAAYQERVKGEIQKTLEKNPQWTNPAALKKDLDNMSTFVGEAYGFTPQEFFSIEDARLIEVVKDAMAYRSNVKQAREKLAKPIPKFQQATSRKPKQVTKLDKLVTRAKTATGSQKRGAEIDAIAQLFSDNGI